MCCGSVKIIPCKTIPATSFRATSRRENLDAASNTQTTAWSSCTSHVSRPPCGKNRYKHYNWVDWQSERPKAQRRGPITPGPVLETAESSTREKPTDENKRDMNHDEIFRQSTKATRRSRGRTGLYLPCKPRTAASKLHAESMRCRFFDKRLHTPLNTLISKSTHATTQKRSE